MTEIEQADLLAALAGELDAAKAQLEQLGVALIMNPQTAAAHTKELQALDHVGQRCATIADILRSADLKAASHGASLESIANRVQQPPAGFVPTDPAASSGDVEWYN